MKTENYNHKWKYENNERPQGCCYDCRRSYDQFQDMDVPNDLWEKINPTNIERAGLLCPTCIANRLNFIGLWYADDLFILYTKNNRIEMIDIIKQEQNKLSDYIKKAGINESSRIIGKTIGYTSQLKNKHIKLHYETYIKYNKLFDKKT